MCIRDRDLADHVQHPGDLGGVALAAASHQAGQVAEQAVDQHLPGKLGNRRDHVEAARRHDPDLAGVGIQFQEGRAVIAAQLGGAGADGGQHPRLRSHAHVDKAVGQVMHCLLYTSRCV